MKPSREDELALVITVLLVVAAIMVFALLNRPHG